MLTNKGDSLENIIKGNKHGPTILTAMEDEMSTSNSQFEIENQDNKEKGKKREKAIDCSQLV